MHPLFYILFYPFFFTIHGKDVFIYRHNIKDIYCVEMQAQADLLVDLAVPHGDDSSSALTTSNGSVKDNYRQAQLAAWWELWPSVDLGPLRAVVSLVNSLWDPSFN